MHAIKSLSGAILTVEDVREIRQRLKNNESCSQIAKKFKVSYRAIWKIKTNKTWLHVA